MIDGTGVARMMELTSHKEHIMTR
jgi:hypothetical protein